MRDEIVVTTAAGDRAQLAGAIENLEDDPGVVSQAADNGEVDLHVIRQAALLELPNELVELFAPAAAVEHLEDRAGEGTEALGRFLARLTFALVDHSEQFAPALFRHILRAEQIGPEFAVAQPNDDVLGGETEAAQEIDREGDDLHIRRGRSVADQVAVELVMFAQTAALLFFVTKTLRDGEPLQRLAEFAFMRRDDTGQTGRELRAHRYFAVTFVGEIKKLPDDFGAALFLIELGRLENGRVPFHKTVAAANVAPARKDGVTKGAVVGQEIAEAGKWLHW